MTRAEVLDYALERYGTRPDAPWADSPDAVILRHEPGGRWYGLIMSVARGRLRPGAQGVADILNVKCEPLLVDALAGQPGFARAYHMNKTHWLSIVLDEAPDDEQVRWLLDESYRLTDARRAGRK